MLSGCPLRCSTKRLPAGPAGSTYSGFPLRRSTKRLPAALLHNVSGCPLLCSTKWLSAALLHNVSGCRPAGTVGSPTHRSLALSVARSFCRPNWVICTHGHAYAHAHVFVRAPVPEYIGRAVITSHGRRRGRRSAIHSGGEADGRDGSGCSCNDEQSASGFAGNCCAEGRCISRG